ncbi:MAG: hypothetical protein CFH01_01118 [Alphaproteobacteria bacterium MarineAlpha2_Bin1]|nr:MAG: hypothetical protein CFH01_01118 [Alphaproteobacteria bacterium MarineAlpha2_Bin1]|tara:strand:+ start:1789 stop:2232 length:444 start_codon:yes stop_codon:yes gene_type:complete
MNLPKRINDLLNVINKLSKIIITETEHLKKNKRPSEIKSFEKDKTTLSNYYEKEIKELSKLPKDSFIESTSELELLKSTLDKFKKILDDHNRALFAAKTVTERMIKSISEEVAKINNPTRGYNNYSKNFLTSKSIHKPVSIALNEII